MKFVAFFCQGRGGLQKEEPPVQLRKVAAVFAVP
jgi:hypothetical protein